MLVGLGLAGLALRRGLRLRASRRRRERRPPDLRRGHLRMAKPAVALVAVGFAGGPLSMVWLRGEPAFGTAHALFGTAALALFLATAGLGRRIERHRSRALDAHGWLGLAAFLLAALAAVAGFAIL